MLLKHAMQVSRSRLGNVKSLDMDSGWLAPGEKKLYQKFTGNLNISAKYINDEDFKEGEPKKVVNLKASAIGPRAFYCVMAEKLSVEAEEVGAYAFFASKLSELEIAQGTKILSDYSFSSIEGLDEKELCVPFSVESIGRFAFSKTNLKALRVRAKGEIKYAGLAEIRAETVIFDGETPLSLGVDAISLLARVKKIIINNPNLEIKEKSISIGTRLPDDILEIVVGKMKNPITEREDFSRFICEGETRYRMTRMP